MAALVDAALVRLEYCVDMKGTCINVRSHITPAKSVSHVIGCTTQ
ncbi:hypothetical protein IWX65_000704 [Arthrobacter sp. CAN_A214]